MGGPTPQPTLRREGMLLLCGLVYRLGPHYTRPVRGVTSAGVWPNIDVWQALAGKWKEATN